MTKAYNTEEERKAARYESSKKWKDHNHKTGKVRGLLCSSCNLILGYCNDNRDILSRLIVYLDVNNE